MNPNHFFAPALAALHFNAGIVRFACEYQSNLLKGSGHQNIDRPAHAEMGGMQALAEAERSIIG